MIAPNSADFTAGYPTAATPSLISSQINGNGNDVYALYFGGDNSLGELRDIYGVVGEEGAGTWDYTDKRAVRKSSVVTPNPVWTASEWVVASAASAKMTPGAHPDTAPVITSALTASATVGTAFEYQIAADNNPTVYSAVGLPVQLQFNAATGLISGTPATAETLSVTIEATNGGGTDTKQFTITVTDVVEGTTYNDWLQAQGVTPSDANAAMLDYAFGATTLGALDPTRKPSVAIVPPAGGAGGDTATLVLTYYVRQNAVGLTVTPNLSLDLSAVDGGFAPLDPTQIEGHEINDLGGGVSVQRMTASVPMIGDRKFLKLEVLQQ